MDRLLSADLGNASNTDEANNFLANHCDNVSKAVELLQKDLVIEGDWLFSGSTLHCGCGEWDNNAETITSRIFLPVLFSLGCLAVVAVADRDESCKKRKRKDDEQDGFNELESEGLNLESAVQKSGGGPKQAHRYDLDFARVVCICCVVAEHSGGASYSDDNLFFAQNWVLPWLYTISGICSMFSKAPMLSSLSKYFAVFAVGVAANWVADLITGRDWKGDFGNTIFQMAYMLGLMMLITITQPLRSAMHTQDTSRDATLPKSFKIYTCVLGFIALSCFGMYAMGSQFIDLKALETVFGELEGTGVRALLFQFPMIVGKLFGLLTMVCLAMFRGGSGWIPWVLLVLIYVSTVVVPFSWGGHAFRAELFLYGMVVFHWPYAGKAKVVSAVREYWPLMLGIMLFTSVPSTTGRCDLNPLNTWWERSRYYTLEAFLLVLLCSGSMNTSDSLNMAGWLNMWALFAFVFHVMFARLLETFQKSYGAILTYAFVPVFYVLLGRKKKKEKGDATQQDESDSSTGEDASE